MSFGPGVGLKIPYLVTSAPGVPAVANEGRSLNTVSPLVSRPVTMLNGRPELYVINGLTLIAFFLSSSALSHFRQAHKQALAAEKFEKGGRRDLAQTLANGGIGALLALAYGLSGTPIALLAVRLNRLTPS